MKKKMENRYEGTKNYRRTDRGKFGRDTEKQTYKKKRRKEREKKEAMNTRGIKGLSD